MTSSILITKLYPLPIKPNLVLRQDLIDRLTGGVNRKAALISAPAGFGKTTLISAWLDQLLDIEAAWLSLDKDDNQLSRFLTYLIAALSRTKILGDDFGQEALGVLDYPQPVEIEKILIPILNEIADATKKIVLVLDDFHLIDDQEILDALAYALENLPHQLHLVIATRQDPSLPLGRLRAQDQLTELRAADLRFSVEETAEFLNRLMGLDLSTAEIAQLETKTEGWIAGLQLAALSMRGREDVPGFIQAFSGGHRMVLDFLIEEVLAMQEQEITEFLLRTSILDSLTGPLCDALTNRNDGQQTLENLYRANLFIIPLDEERHWYRYHHLFRELLLIKLQAEFSELEPDLHIRAAGWYEGEKIAKGAIEHALKANDYILAAKNLEQFGNHLGTWNNIQSGTVLRWIRTIPSEIVNQNAWLGLYAARAYAHAGQFDKAELALSDLGNFLENNPDAIENAELMSQRISGNKAVYASFRGRCQDAISIAKETLKRASDSNILAQTRANRALGYAYTHLGDVTQAKNAFQQEIDISRSAKIYSSTVSGMYLLASLEIIQGKLRKAHRVCQEARKWSRVDGKRIAADGLLCLPSGEILYQQNKLEQAENLLDTDLQLLGQNGITDYFGSGHALLARIKQGLGDQDGAIQTVRRARSIAEASNLELYISRIKAIQAQIWLSQGDLEEANQWAEKFQQADQTEYLKEYENLVLIRVLLANKQPDAALERLDSLLAPAEKAGRNGRVIEILTLRASAYQAQGNLDSALSALKMALQLAEPEGYIRLFVDQGPPMAQLLYEALKREIAPEYVQRLLAAFPPAEPEDHKSPLDQSGLVEPLSEREIEVLELMAAGLTYQEIAEELYISHHTVKTHSRNIYAKLDVGNRTLAVGKARTLGIIPSA